MICKNCGKEIADNSRFCTLCGAKQEEQSTPAVEIPVQSEVPVQNVAPAQNEAPISQNVPQQDKAQFDNTTPAQTVVDPVGQPAGTPFQPMAQGGKKFDFKKYLPMIIGIAVAVVVVVIAVISVVSIVSNSGAKGAVNRFVDAVNDYDAEGILECSVDSWFLDEDDFKDVVEVLDDSFDDFKDADFEIDVEFKSEKDITDDDSENEDKTWKEAYQEYLEETDNYDDQEVEAVKEVRVKLTCDYDKDYKVLSEGDEEELEDIKKFTCLKIDGDWYILDNFFSSGIIIGLRIKNLY